MAEAVTPRAAALAPAANQQRQGMLLFLAALLAFACYDAFAKQMLAHYPATLMNLTRYAAVGSMAAVLLGRHGDWRVWRQPHQGLLLLRSLMLAIVATSFMTALASMPLAEATAIYFTAPLIMVALSPRVLGEQVGRVQWVAVLVGFAGMLLIVRPGGALPLTGTLLMALAAVLCPVPGAHAAPVGPGAGPGAIRLHGGHVPGGDQPAGPVQCPRGLAGRG